jgi:hypothetical protein
VLPFCLRARFFKICEVLTGFAIWVDLIGAPRDRVVAIAPRRRLPIQIEIC